MRASAEERHNTNYGEALQLQLLSILNSKSTAY